MLTDISLNIKLHKQESVRLMCENSEEGRPIEKLQTDNSSGLKRAERILSLTSKSQRTSRNSQGFSEAAAARG
ncbi:hypothetical protein H920_03340 [Fukomys damarensis]|uniref:Uncharacterized protein n=1 Tax=Fukomys damarensis TaxID=885580 RepID=A0A091DY74_FUKDA|nr:hypothetical protein H920_03340 [Fukomys damarensis]